MSMSSPNPSKRVRPAVSRAERCAAPKYPRPPETDGNIITREAVALYGPAWARVRRKAK